MVFSKKRMDVRILGIEKFRSLKLMIAHDILILPNRES